jgi:uncharacterized protein (TIGR02246 family)
MMVPARPNDGIKTQAPIRPADDARQQACYPDPLNMFQRGMNSMNKRMTAFAYAITAAAFLGPASAQAPSTMTCAPINQQEVAALFDRWNASLATHDADKVTANYAPDAVLLPTVSNQPRTDSAEIKDYFVHFLERDPQGTIDTRTIRIGCNAASDVGTYTFRLAGKTPGTTDMLKARYSFDYELRDGKWVIVHHHASMMPEPVQ